MDRNKTEFWVFSKVSSVARVSQAGRSLLKLLAKALSIWKNIQLLATAVSGCFDTFLPKLGSEDLKDWQPWIENAEYKLVKIFIFHVAFAERTFTDTMMANQDGIGNQLLHQRPDLVRRAWVPVLVGIFVHYFMIFICWIDISRLDKLSAVPRLPGSVEQDPTGFHCSYFRRTILLQYDLLELE